MHPNSLSGPLTLVVVLLVILGWVLHHLSCELLVSSHDRLAVFCCGINITQNKFLWWYYGSVELTFWQLKASGEVARRVGRGTWRYIQSRSFSNGILRNSLKKLPVRRFFSSDGELPEKKQRKKKNMESKVSRASGHCWVMKHDSWHVCLYIMFFLKSTFGGDQYD